MQTVFAELRNRGGLAALLLVGAAQLAAAAELPPVGSFLRALGVANHDGDTVQADPDGLAGPRPALAIRLAAIDAPELAQPHGRASQRWLARRVVGQPLLLLIAAHDRYGRAVAHVLRRQPAGWRDLSAEALRDGQAWHYAAYSTDPDLAAFERAARAAGRGLWADPDPVPPWDFRRRPRARRLLVGGGSPPARSSIVQPRAAAIRRRRSTYSGGRTASRA